MKEFEDARGIVGIEVAGRFVGEQQRRAVNQSAGHGGALHLSAAHLVGKRTGARGESDQLEHPGRADPCLFRAVAAQEQREFDVFQRGHRGEEIEKLEHDAEVSAAVSSESVLVRVVQCQSVDDNLAGGRLIEAPEKVEECAFSAAARTGHCAEREGLDFQRDIAQGVHFAGRRGINAGNMAQADHRNDEGFRSERRAQDNFRVVAEGEDWIVVDKPAGLLTHPTRPDGAPTLWDGLRQLFAYELANRGQLSIITRLDRETSGLVLLALTPERARSFGLAMQRGGIGKEYVAVVHGWPEWDEKTVDAPIIRQGEVCDSPVWLKRCVHTRGAEACTEFRVARRFVREGREFAVVRTFPRTGRTHQIRVHAAHAGHPLVGDKIYGGREGGAYLEFIETGWTARLEAELLLPRHALHAAALQFEVRGEIRKVAGPTAQDLLEFTCE